MNITQKGYISVNCGMAMNLNFFLQGYYEQKQAFEASSWTKAASPAKFKSTQTVPCRVAHHEDHRYHYSQEKRELDQGRSLDAAKACDREKRKFSKATLPRIYGRLINSANGMVSEIIPTKVRLNLTQKFIACISLYKQYYQG